MSIISAFSDPFDSEPIKNPTPKPSLKRLNIAPFVADPHDQLQKQGLSGQTLTNSDILLEQKAHDILPLCKPTDALG